MIGSVAADRQQLVLRLLTLLEFAPGTLRPGRNQNACLSGHGRAFYSHSDKREI